jgi:hypothetical protein
LQTNAKPAIREELDGAYGALQVTAGIKARGYLITELVDRCRSHPTAYTDRSATRRETAIGGAMPSQLLSRVGTAKDPWFSPARIRRARR